MSSSVLLSECCFSSASLSPSVRAVKGHLARRDRKDHKDTRCVIVESFSCNDKSHVLFHACILNPSTPTPTTTTTRVNLDLPALEDCPADLDRRQVLKYRAPPPPTAQGYMGAVLAVCWGIGLGLMQVQ